MRSTLVKPLRTRLGVATAIIALLLAALTPALLRAADSQPNQRTDLKVLLMTTNSGSTNPVVLPDGIYETWRQVLEMEGIPYATFDSSKQDLSDAFLADYGANHAKYQAIIMTTGNMAEEAYGHMTTAEIAALTKYETTFGIRQITDQLWPTPVHGLVSPTDPAASGPQDGKVGALTAAGKAVFPELRGQVPVPDNNPSVGETYGTLTLPASPNFTTLVSAPAPNAGSPFLGTYTRPNGVEEMVMSVTSNPFQSHNQLLRRGMIRWVTRGVHLGSPRTYFASHIDDIFIPTTKWSPTLKCTPGNDDPTTCPPGPGDVNVVDIRMQPSDTAAALAWQSAHGIKFDMVFNGYGYHRGPNGEVVPDDAFGDNILQPSIRDQFRWINHTWSHENLDTLPLNDPNGEFKGLNQQIQPNIPFAATHGITIDPRELVTGEHSGLGSYPGKPFNLAMIDALTENGIQWVADDASVQSAQRQIGPATTVPRHPSNIYYNVATRSDQLDEYNWIYLNKNNDPRGNCNPAIRTDCRDTYAGWDVYTASEVGIMFNHLTGNDPRPHYMHQPNLMVDGNGHGIMYGSDNQGVLDRLFARYDQYFDRSVAPITNPTMTEAGIAIRQQTAWAAAKNNVTAYIQNGKVTITTASSIDVPITGTTVGGVDTDARSGWQTVAGTVALDVAPVVAPSVSGGNTPGSTLTATPGRWSLGASLSGAWLRCDAAGNACAPTGTGGATYVVTPADQGASIRYSESESWTRGVALSNAVGIPAPSVSQPVPVPPTKPQARITSFTLAPAKFFPSKKAKDAKDKRRRTVATWNMSAPAKVTLSIQRKTTAKVNVKVKVKVKGKVKIVTRKKTVIRWVVFQNVSIAAKKGKNTYTFSGLAKGKRIAVGPGRMQIWTTNAKGAKIDVRTRAFTALAK